MKKQREVQEINASSMADISFLLLVFFLVSTSMATDEGLSRQLPPPIRKEQKIEKVDIKPRNIMTILVNSNDELMVNGNVISLNELKEKAKEFIANPSDDPSLPEKETIQVPYFGNYAVTKQHVISLQNDRGTDYWAYIAVQNELVAAYDELRNEISKSKFGKNFDDLDSDEQSAVKKIYPQKISEAEPKNYGGGNN